MKKAFSRTVAVVALAIGVHAQSVAPSPNSLPWLGDSRADVVRSMGEPEAIYSPRAQLIYKPSERDIALSSAGFVADIYTRTFSGIEFRVQVLYRSDASTSRLHPIERVTDIEFTPDKNIPLSRLVAIIPSTVNLCAAGCNLMGVAFGTYQAFLFPTSPSTAQSTLAAEVGSGFQSASSEYAFRPCETISFQEKPRTGENSLPSFNGLTVNTVRLGVCSPESEKHWSHGLYKELPAVQLP